MLVMLIIVAAPLVGAMFSHFGRDSRPARFEVARDTTGRPVAIVAIDPHTERSQIVRVLP